MFTKFFVSDFFTDGRHLKLSTSANVLLGVVFPDVSATAVLMGLLHHSKNFNSSYDGSFRGKYPVNIARNLTLRRFFLSAADSDRPRYVSATKLMRSFPKALRLVVV